MKKNISDTEYWNEIKEELNRVIPLFEKIDDLDLTDDVSCQEAGFKNEQDYKYVEQLRNRANDFIEFVLSQFNYDKEDQEYRKKYILKSLVEVYLLNNPKEDNGEQYTD